MFLAEIGLLSNNQQLYNLGVRYNFEYDDKKSNVSKYVPIELKYQNMFLENTGIQYIDITPNSYSEGYKTVAKHASCRYSKNLKSSFTRVNYEFKFLESLNNRLLKRSLIMYTS